MAHLVDTDILIDMTRGHRGAIDHLDGLGDWSISSMTSLELLAGARDSREIASIDIMI